MHNFRLLRLGSGPASQQRGTAALQLLSRCALLIAVLAALVGCGEGGGDNTPKAKPYTLGTKLRFGTGGNGIAFLTSGWSSPEAGHTWSDKPVAVLTLGHEANTEPMVLRMQLSGLKKAPELPSQPVEVLANGTKIADWEVADEAERVAEIPAQLVSSAGALRIELKIPKATSPKQLGLGNDERVLGISVHSLSIAKGAK